MIPIPAFLYTWVMAMAAICSDFGVESCSTSQTPRLILCYNNNIRFTQTGYAKGIGLPPNTGTCDCRLRTTGGQIKLRISLDVSVVNTTTCQNGLKMIFRPSVGIGSTVSHCYPDQVTYFTVSSNNILQLEYSNPGRIDSTLCLTYSVNEGSGEVIAECDGGPLPMTTTLATITRSPSSTPHSPSRTMGPTATITQASSTTTQQLATTAHSPTTTRTTPPTNTRTPSTTTLPPTANTQLQSTTQSSTTATRPAVTSTRLLPTMIKQPSTTTRALSASTMTQQNTNTPLSTNKTVMSVPTESPTMERSHSTVSSTVLPDMRNTSTPLITQQSSTVTDNTTQATHGTETAKDTTILEDKSTTVLTSTPESNTTTAMYHSSTNVTGESTAGHTVTTTIREESTTINPLGTQRIVGIIAGCVIGAIGIIVLTVFLISRWKKRRQMDHALNDAIVEEGPILIYDDNWATKAQENSKYDDQATEKCSAPESDQSVKEEEEGNNGDNQ